MFGRKLPAAVLWDMDGTLVDSEEYWLSSEQSLANEFNGSWGEQDGLDLIGMSLYDSSMVMKAKMGLELEPEEIINNSLDILKGPNTELSVIKKIIQIIQNKEEGLLEIRCYKKDKTECIASVTFGLDISICFVIDISFEETWQESRQIA